MLELASFWIEALLSEVQLLNLGADLTISLWGTGHGSNFTSYCNRRCVN